MNARIALLALSSLTLLGGVAPAFADGPVQVWAAPESYKIDKFGKKIFTLDAKQNLEAMKKKNRLWDGASQTITLAGGRGETLAFQLGIEGGEAGLTQVDVKATALKSGANELPASAVSLFKVYYTQLTDRGSGPTNSPTMGKGWYPDALVPWNVPDTDVYGGYDGPPFAIKGGEIQGVWVDVAIPYGTPPGEYTGTLTVTSGGAGGAAAATPGAIKLVVKVRDFDIPRKLHNMFFINFDVNDLSQAGAYWLKGDKLTAYEDAVYRDARKHRFTAGNMYNIERPSIKETAEGLTSVDWTRYDSRCDKVLNPKTNLFGPGEDAIEVWKVPLVTDVKGNKFPSQDKAWDQMIAEIKKHWADKGWDFSRAYVYLSDEPPADAAKKLNEYAQRIKNSPGPNLRRQVAVYTMLGREWDKQQWVFDLWKDNLDMWMVAGDYYNAKLMDALPKGALKGLYQGAEPFQGNDTLDTDGIAFRTWSWVSWQYRIDYLCYYSMGGGHHKAVPVAGNPDKFQEVRRPSLDCDIWDHPRNRTWAVSQGVFCYPGKRVGVDLPIWNLRTKEIRRGQTDYEYFWLLKQAGEGALADSLCKGVLNVAVSEAADRAEQYGAGKWSHNPDDWDAAVQKAGEKLEELKAKLPKEPAKLEAGK